MYPSSWYGLCDELPEGRSGTPLALDGHREYERQFLVSVTQNGKLMGPIGVCSHPFLPRPWSYYVTNTEFDTAALLVRYQAKQRVTDDWTQWIVTASYSTNTNNGNFQAPTGGAPGDLPNNPSSAYNNPEYEWPDIEWNFDEQLKPALTDLDGKPYMNTANQPFTPPVQFPRAYKVLNISRNELGFNSDVAAEYAYAVNDRPFLKYPAGFVQCMPPKAVQRYKGTIRYWRVTYQLKFHPRGIWLPKVTGYIDDVPTIDKQNYELNWQVVIQNQGYMRLENRRDANDVKFPNFGKPVHIMGADNRPITQQVLLDGDGQPVTARFQPPDAQAGLLVPYYLKFRQFPSKNFTALINRGFV